MTQNIITSAKLSLNKFDFRELEQRLWRGFKTHNMKARRNHNSYKDLLINHHVYLVYWCILSIVSMHVYACLCYYMYAMWTPANMCQHAPKKRKTYEWERIVLADMQLKLNCSKLWGPWTLRGPKSVWKPSVLATRGQRGLLTWVQDFQDRIPICRFGLETLKLP